MIRFVAQIHQHGQLAGVHLCGDLLQHLGWRDLVGQADDHHIAVLALVAGAGANAAAADGVCLQNLISGRGDDAVGWEIRAVHVRHQLVDASARMIQQMHAGARYFAQVVRWNVGCHAHGDAGAAVHQQHRQPRRQQFRLFQYAVEVRHEIDGALIDFV